MKSYCCSLAFFIFLFSVSLTHASYSMTELERTVLDVPDNVILVEWDGLDTNNPDVDDDKALVPIGFAFPFDNIEYNYLTVFTNGILKFLPIDQMHLDHINESLPTREGNGFIAVYWDNLVDDNNSSITYGNLGIAPNRKFVVNWTNVRSYSLDLRYEFQVVLYENGDIRYRYNNNISNGESATIGLEINDSDFIQYAFNSSSALVSFDLLFRNQLLVLPAPFLQYRLDEMSWGGSTTNVVDSSLNGLNGSAFLGANISNLLPAVVSDIGSCNYGSFDGIDDYVEIPDSHLLDFDNNFSVGVWIKIDEIPASGLKTIISKAENYQLNVNASGQINWRWQTAILKNDREINSSVSLTSGVWSHVVISFATGNQYIYINGVESGHALFIENTLTNSAPLQLASDQNVSGRYLKGSIDEVNVFNQALSEQQARELMMVTRPCSLLDLCVSSFPDGLNSHSNGTITFGLDAQIFFSPDDILDSSSVIIAGASSNQSCVSIECQSNGLTSDVTTPVPFPNTAGFSDSLIIDNNNSGSNDPSKNQYNEINVGDGSVLSIAGSFDDFYIDSLSLDNNAVLELLPGNYWIRTLDTGATIYPSTGIEIRVLGSGTARIYINGNVLLGDDFLANSPSQKNQGDSSLLFLYSYSDITIAPDSTFSGIIYAAGDVDIQRDNNVYGAIAGNNISLGHLTNVYYKPMATAHLDFGELCQSAGCVLGGFDIFQPAYALACSGIRTKISIQAMCDDGNSIKDDYAGTVYLVSNENSLSQFYDSLTSVPVVSSSVFDGSESGIKDVFLFHQNENPTLQISATDAVESITSVSTNLTDFRKEGFAIDDPDSFICGGNTNVILTAIGEDDNGLACQKLSGFIGVKSLKAWYEVNINSTPGADFVTTDLLIDSQSVNAQYEPAANNVDITFNSGVADIAIAYANAGQILGVNFKYDDAPYDGSIPELANVDLFASTGSFIASPEKITLEVDTANGLCVTGDAGCSKLVSAGSPFLVTAQAQCIGSTIADNYQGTINFSHSLVAPLPGSPGSILTPSAVISAVNSGEVQINQSISEVGVFNLSVSDDDYFGQTIPVFTLLNVGRFYPENFLSSSEGPVNSCGSFSYMSQPGLKIEYSLQAQQAGGGQTFNYKGSFAKATIAMVAENDNDGGNYQARLLGYTAANWIDGEYVFVDTGQFSRAANVDGPFRMLQVGILFSDNDGDDSNIVGLDMRSDTSSDCNAIGDCNAVWLGKNLDIRFGQLMLSNVFGPVIFSLDMEVQTEYYDGTHFVLSTDDNCTSLSITSPSFSQLPLSWTGNLATGDTAPSLVTNLSAGKAEFRFSAAGLGNEGSVIFEYDTNTATNSPWLNTENDADADYDDNPLGTITFGQFRGNDRIIYWREIVR
jgi:MSHA biogenesis protein MshQ